MKNIKMEISKNGELQYIKSEGFVIGATDGTDYIKLKKIDNKVVVYSAIKDAPYKNIPISFSKDDDNIEYCLTEKQCKDISGFNSNILEFAIFKDYMYFVKIDKTIESAEKRLSIRTVYKTPVSRLFPGLNFKTWKKGEMLYIKSFIQTHCWEVVSNKYTENLGHFKELIPLFIDERKNRTVFNYSVPLSFIAGPAFENIQLFIQPYKDSLSHYKVNKIELDGPYTMEMLKEIPGNIIGSSFKLYYKTPATDNEIYGRITYFELLAAINKATIEEYLYHDGHSNKIKTITIEL